MVFSTLNLTLKVFIYIVHVQQITLRSAFALFLLLYILCALLLLPLHVLYFVALSYHPLIKLFMFASHIAPTLTTNIDLLTQKKYLIVANYHLSRAFYI